MAAPQGQDDSQDPWTPALDTWPLKIQRNEQWGRYLVCARAVRAGELLLSEKAIVLGPVGDATEPLCLTCFRRLPQPAPLCPRCKAAPLCPTCDHDKAHPGPAECQWLRSRPEGAPAPPLAAVPRLVTAMRCLILRREGSDSWNRVSQLEAHVEARRKAGDWQDVQENVVQALEDSCLLSEEEEETAALVQRVCGIMDVNTFEVRGRTDICYDGEDPVPLRALFPTAALLSHDCLPCALVAVNEDAVMHVRSARPLDAGESVTLSYGNFELETTSQRREHLRLGKYFECNCSRCVDPSEFGIRVSGVRCPRCHKGDLLPLRPDETKQREQSDPDPPLRCTICPHRASPQLARTAHARARDLVGDAVASGDERAMEALLSELRRSFPPLAAPALDLRQALISSYRQRMLSSPRPARALLRRLVELCGELLPALEVLCPPLARERALTHYELHGALLALAHRDHGSEGPAEAAALARSLRVAEEHLAAAVRAFLLEPARSPEGRLAKMAVSQLRDLREEIKEADTVAKAQEEAVAEMRRRRNRRPDAPAPAPAPATPGKENSAPKKNHKRGGRKKAPVSPQS